MRRALSGAPGALAVDQPTLLTRPFLLLCLIGFLGYAHSQLLVPILPLFVQAMGGSVLLVGVVAAAFSISSFATRPWIGRAVDSWSVRGVTTAGTAVLGLSALLYLVYHPVLLLATRVMHGAGWAAFNTAGYTLLANAAPAGRRGEASGYYSMWQGLANVFMPPLGIALLGAFGFAAAFWVSAVLGVVAAASTRALPPDLRSAATAETTTAGAATAPPQALYERGALLAFGLEATFKLSNPAFQVFIPLFAVSLGVPLAELGFYYAAYGAVIVFGRGPLGRISDRFGRGNAILLATGLVSAALVIVATATGVPQLVIAGIVYQLGSSTATPAIMALAIDRSRAERRGAAMATYSMGYQVAFSAGSLAWGVAASVVGFSGMYLVALASPLAAAGVVLRNRRNLDGPPAQ